MTRYVAAVVASLLVATSLVDASDHLDAPSLSGRGQVDVNDLYAFQSPSNADNTVLIMTVNPFASNDAKFGTDVQYEFLIDNTGDAIADLTFGTSFSGSGTTQNLSLSRNGTLIATGSTSATIPITGGGLMQAGRFDDPFFFDLAGFNNGFAFTGTDAFAGADISGIVVEVPSSTLGGPDIGVWARTVQGGSQVDRAGRPAINTALIPSDSKEAFNLGAPAQDPPNFGDEVRETITMLSDATNANALTGILLPDVLTLDTSSSAGFLNGRKLADDVIDAELNLLSAGAVTGDGVDMNDAAFRSSFPYLAVANIPEPSSIILGLSAIVIWCGVRRHNRRV